MQRWLHPSVDGPSDHVPDLRPGHRTTCQTSDQAIGPPDHVDACGSGANTDTNNDYDHLNRRTRQTLQDVDSGTVPPLQVGHGEDIKMNSRDAATEDEEAERPTRRASPSHMESETPLVIHIYLDSVGLRGQWSIRAGHGCDRIKHCLRRFESRLQLSASTSRCHGNGVLRPTYWCVGVRRVRRECYPGYVNGELNFLGLLDPEACRRISQETDATRMGGLGTTNVRLARVCQSPHFTLDQGSNLKPFEPWEHGHH
jgi:hypothetical protein